MKKLIFVLILIISAMEARFFVGVSGGYLGVQALSSSDEKITKTTPPSIIATSATIPSTITSGGSDISTEQKDTSETYNGLLTKIVLGIEDFPHTDYIGWRWELAGAYGSYFYTDPENKTRGHGSLFLGEFFADSLINFYIKPEKFSIGIFAGVGLSWRFNDLNLPFKKHILAQGAKKLEEDTWNSLSIGGRIGLTTLINNHHRFELYASFNSVTQEEYNLKSSSNGGKETKDGKYSLGFGNTRMLLSYKYVF